MEMRKNTRSVWGVKSLMGIDKTSEVGYSFWGCYLQDCWEVRVSKRWSVPWLVIFHHWKCLFTYVQWGKKVFSQPPIVQVLQLKKMREVCNFHHRNTSTMTDKIRWFFSRKSHCITSQSLSDHKLNFNDPTAYCTLQNHLFELTALNCEETGHRENALAGLRSLFVNRITRGRYRLRGSN